MQRRNEIKNSLTKELISMQIYYQLPDFKTFDVHTKFEQWAAVEVTDFNAFPHDMETFILPGGLYAVFTYKGSSSDPSIFQCIFTTWLPSSGYLLDDRPHFELLGEKYKNDDPSSEEEIWVPIKEQ